MITDLINLKLAVDWDGGRGGHNNANNAIGGENKTYIFQQEGMNHATKHYEVNGK